MMDTMPQYDPSNEPSTRNETVASSQVPPIGLNPEYPRTIRAILKIIEIVIDVILFICVGASGFSFTASGSWLNFVSSFTFIVVIIFYIFYLFNIIYHLPGPWILIEMIIVIVFSVLHLIAMIVAAAKSGGVVGGYIAAAVFFTVNLIIFAVEAFFLFKEHRASGAYHKNSNNPGTGTTSTGNDYRI